MNHWNLRKVKHRQGGRGMTAVYLINSAVSQALCWDARDTNETWLCTSWSFQPGVGGDLRSVTSVDRGQHSVSAEPARRVHNPGWGQDKLPGRGNAQGESWWSVRVRQHRRMEDSGRRSSSEWGRRWEPGLRRQSTLRALSLCYYSFPIAFNTIHM